MSGLARSSDGRAGAVAALPQHAQREQSGINLVTTSAASCCIKGKADPDRFADVCARCGAIAKKVVKDSDRDPRAIPVGAIRSWLH